MKPEGEVGLEPLLDGVEPLLLQPPDLDAGERLVGKLGQRRSAPQRERLAEPLGGALGLFLGQGRPALGHETLEVVQVERVRLDADQVAAAERDDDIAQLAAQARDVNLQCLGRGGRRIVAPEFVDQVVPRHHLWRVEQ